MKVYYLDGERISEDEAKIIMEENNEIIKNGSIEDWKKCKLIIVIEE